MTEKTLRLGIYDVVKVQSMDVTDFHSRLCSKPAMAITAESVVDDGTAVLAYIRNSD